MAHIETIKFESGNELHVETHDDGALKLFAVNGLTGERFGLGENAVHTWQTYQVAAQAYERASADAEMQLADIKQMIQPVYGDDIDKAETNAGYAPHIELYRHAAGFAGHAQHVCERSYSNLHKACDMQVHNGEHVREAPARLWLVDADESPQSGLTRDHTPRDTGSIKI